MEMIVPGGRRIITEKDPMYQPNYCTPKSFLDKAGKKKSKLDNLFIKIISKAALRKESF
jgi:hypothetical protein